MCPILWPFPLYFGLIFRSAWWTPKATPIDLKFFWNLSLYSIMGLATCWEKNKQLLKIRSTLTSGLRPSSVWPWVDLGWGELWTTLPELTSAQFMLLSSWMRDCCLTGMFSWTLLLLWPSSDRRLTTWAKRLARHVSENDQFWNWQEVETLTGTILVS